MGKYEPLTHYLEKRDGETWDAEFAEVERILGFPLPRSAYDYPAWWANQQPGHSQTRGWRDAGWETGQVDLAAKKVRFRRREAAKNVASQRGPHSHVELWEKAHKLTGIEDREQLVALALDALIQRETARFFSEIGGSMPDFVAAPRERPFA